MAGVHFLLMAGLQSGPCRYFLADQIRYADTDCHNQLLSYRFFFLLGLSRWDGEGGGHEDTNVRGRWEKIVVKTEDNLSPSNT